MSKSPAAVGAAQREQAVGRSVGLGRGKGAEASPDDGGHQLPFAAKQRADRRCRRPRPGGNVTQCQGGRPLLGNHGSGGVEQPVAEPGVVNNGSQQVFPGRFTANPETESVTVFLIGMRANRWWKPGPTLRVAAAMPRMLNHLARNPESGLPGFHQWLGRTTILLSYWESPEHLQRFAADRAAPRLAPWRRLMKEYASTGNVGIWHETYQVPTKDLETVYSDMPAFGLAAATQGELAVARCGQDARSLGTGGQPGSTTAGPG